MKNIRLIFIILTAILSIVFICNYICVPVKTIGYLKVPKVCLSSIIVNNNLILAGGYENYSGEKSFDVDVFDLDTFNYTKRLKSNFNNSYNNFLFPLAGDRFGNVQLLKFEPASSTGVEVFGKESGIGKLIKNSGFIPRMSDSVVTYNVLSSINNKQLETDSLYAIGGKNYYNNYGINGLEGYDFINEKKSNIPLRYSKGYLSILSALFNTSDRNFYLQNINAISPLKSVPEVYKLHYSIYGDLDYIIVDKNSDDARIQSYWVSGSDIDSPPVLRNINVPAFLKGYELKQVLQTDMMWSLLFVFRNGNNVVLATYDTDRYPQENKSLYVRKYMYVPCKYSNFVYVSTDYKFIKLLLVGSMKTKENNFTCGDSVPKDARICSQIQEIKIKMYY